MPTSERVASDPSGSGSDSVWWPTPREEREGTGPPVTGSTTTRQALLSAISHAGYRSEQLGAWHMFSTDTPHPARSTTADRAVTGHRPARRPRASA